MMDFFPSEVMFVICAFYYIHKSLLRAFLIVNGYFTLVLNSAENFNFEND